MAFIPPPPSYQPLTEASGLIPTTPVHVEKQQTPYDLSLSQSALGSSTSGTITTNTARSSSSVILPMERSSSLRATTYKKHKEVAVTSTSASPKSTTSYFFAPATSSSPSSSSSSPLSGTTGIQHHIGDHGQDDDNEQDAKAMMKSELSKLKLSGSSSSE
jgi:hypothetical protein